MNLSLPPASLSDGDGFELIGVRVTEIPNYTVKNRNFNMCWPIIVKYNNKMCVRCICICLEKLEVGICGILEVEIVGNGFA